MIDELDSAYDGALAKSNERVPLLQWWVALVGFIGTIVGGVVLVILLANGAANPPRATNLIIDLPSDEGLDTLPPFDFPLVASLRSYQFPITIEASAQTSPSSGTVWGLWLRSEEGQYIFQIRSDGYFSMLLNSGWRNFIHIQPADNTLNLYIDSDGNATFRINNEIASQASIVPNLLEWGVIRPVDAYIRWDYIRLYAG